jgi:hypothetical protein
MAKLVGSLVVLHARATVKNGYNAWHVCNQSGAPTALQIACWQSPLIIWLEYKGHARDMAWSNDLRKRWRDAGVQTEAR